MADEIMTTTPDCEIVSSRIVDAPRNLVFRAWAEPNHLINWWGPSGFTNTFNVFDFRVGGISMTLSVFWLGFAFLKMNPLTE